LKKSLSETISGKAAEKDDSEFRSLADSGDGVYRRRLERLFYSSKRGMDRNVSRCPWPGIIFHKDKHMETMSTNASAMKTKTKPVHEVRLGAIKAAVWRNETENGVRFNVTLSRLYKDGDQWQSTDSFGRDDLLVVAKVADQAHSWIFAQSQESEAQPAATPTGQPPSSR
jgi:hypothetical protein